MTAASSNGARFVPTSVTGKRYAKGDWEVHYDLTDLDSETENGSGWIRNNVTKRLRRFLVTRGQVRWTGPHFALQLVSRDGPVTYGPLNNLDTVAPILRDFLTHAFDAELA